MKTIYIAETVAHLVPEPFRQLLNIEYRLTKIASKRENFWVSKGDSVIGWAEIVDVLGKPGVRVMRSMSTYIRTSPIMGIKDITDTSITFETEGGVYKLEAAE